MNKKAESFTTFDGQSLSYRVWKGTNSNGKILLFLHRGHEHSARLEEITKNTAFNGYTIYSFDSRGHGYSEAKPTFEFMNLVRDLNSFVSFICIQEKKEEQYIFLIANSVSGVVASTWVHDYAPKIAGMALVAPAFRIKLYIPFAKPLLKLALLFKPTLNITSYVKSKFLTHNKAEQIKYDNDDLITPNIPARQLTTLLDTGERIVADAAMITTPTLVLSAGKDYVVDSKVQGDFYSQLSSPLKRFIELESFYHGVLYENNAQLVFNEIAQFANEAFDYNSTDVSEKLIDVAQQKCDKICYGSLPITTRINYAVQRISLKHLGFMSKGMETGLQYGFDSGVTLDHVYKNQAEGVTILGKLIDKVYLNNIGWKGIRQRKAHSITEIKNKIISLKATGREVKILDIAGGPARYLIEIADEFRDIKIQVRDYQIQNIEQGRQLAEQRGLTNIIYEQSDAFNIENYNIEKFQPNIVVISGIFELFPNNQLITNAIQGVASIIEDLGYLIYTGQPWHPNLRQIAHVLGNHQKNKWVMRCRSQYELDKLFSQYGFEKENMHIDNWGIFTVSSALFKVQ
ncbi:methyltransferase [Vibrio azureus]|nr:bifunctional alpha/beta hydrolase/class I SAM-dependent methyltransferase [Vibrio azureus]AUI88771.1 methyltransferase [Vibrio azureus]